MIRGLSKIAWSCLVPHLTRLALLTTHGVRPGDKKYHNIKYNLLFEYFK